MKWIAIISGVFLLLAIPYGWPYSYYILLRWFISISSAILAWGFYKSELKGWALVFASITFLFNPIIPIFLNKSTWVLIDFVSAATFFLAAYSIKRKDKT